MEKEEEEKRRGRDSRAAEKLGTALDNSS